MLPIATNATASWVARKLKSHGYHWTMLSVPLTSWNRPDAISTRIDARSRPSIATDLSGRVGGRMNSLG